VDRATGTVVVLMHVRIPCPGRGAARSTGRQSRYPELRTFWQRGSPAARTIPSLITARARDTIQIFCCYSPTSGLRCAARIPAFEHVAHSRFLTGLSTTTTSLAFGRTPAPGPAASSTVRALHLTVKRDRESCRHATFSPPFCIASKCFTTDRRRRICLIGAMRRLVGDTRFSASRFSGPPALTRARSSISQIAIRETRHRSAAAKWLVKKKGPDFSKPSARPLSAALHVGVPVLPVDRFRALALQQRCR